MPEGHTIHRLARDLNRAFAGERIDAASPQGRFDAGAERIDGQTVDRFEAWGKHLVGRFESGEALHVHLGLIGKFRRAKGDPVGQVRLRLSVDDVHWDLRGPMVCRLGGPEVADEVASKVGPDPLRKDGCVEEFLRRIGRKRVAIGAALLDQSVVAGIGNVYRAEFCFILGLDPFTPANEVSTDTVGDIWRLAIDQMKVGERIGRIVTVEPAEAGVERHRDVPARERLYVYKRDGHRCRRCRSTIRVGELAGRKVWWCPTCQR